MNATSEPSRPFRRPQPAPELAASDLAAPPRGKRAQAMQRLQVGVVGVLGTLILIGLVSVIENRAAITEAGSVPEAASTAEPGAAEPRSDPLVEAGVVPDLPDTPTPTASAPTPVLPEQGADSRLERDGARAEPIG